MMNQSTRIRAMPAVQPTTIPAIAPGLRLSLEEASSIFWADMTSKVDVDVEVGIVAILVEVTGRVVVGAYQHG
jgi:hypothetical protein